MSCCININWNCLSPSKKNVDYIKEFIDSINQTLQDWNKTLVDYNVKVDTLYKLLDDSGNIDVSKVQTQLDALEEYVNTFIDSQYIKLDNNEFLAYHLCLGSRELVSPIEVPLQADRYSLVIADFNNNGKVYKAASSFNGVKNMYLSGTGEFVALPAIPDVTPIQTNVATNTTKITTLQNLWDTYWKEVKNTEGFIYGVKPAKQFFIKDAPKISMPDLVVADTYYMPLLQKKSVGSTEYTIQGLTQPLQYTNENTKKYFSKAGTWEDIPSSTSGQDNVKELIIDTTYRDLKNLKSLNKLIPGVYYKIIDYQTIVFSDTASSLGKPCPLIVQAVTNSLLSENAIMIVDYDVYYCKYCFDNDKNRFEFVNPYDTIIKSDAGIFYIRDTEQSGPIWRRLEEVSSIQNIIDQYGNNLNPSSEYIQTAKDYGQEEYLEGIDYFENYMYHTPTGFTYANASDNMITIQDTTNSGRIVEVYPTSKGVIYEMTDAKGNTLPYDFIHIIFWNNVISTPAIEGYTFSTHESGGEYYYEEGSSGSANIYKNIVSPIYVLSKLNNIPVQILNNIIYYFEDPNSEGSYYCSNVSFNIIQNTIFKNCYLKNLKFGALSNNNNFENVTITNTSIGSDFSGNTINCEKINCSTFGNNVKNNYFMGNVLNSYIGNKVIDNKFSSLEECILEGSNVDIKSYYVIDASLNKNMYVNLSGCKIGLNTSSITLGIRTASGSDAGTAFKYILDPSITGTSKTIYLRENLNTTTYTTIKNSTNISNVEVTSVTQ